MEAFTDFLVSNYLWFLVISILLVFSLIGYLVDQSEQKKGLSSIHKIREPELNLEELAAMAQNKSLNNAVSDAMRGDMMNQGANNYQAPVQNSNVIQDVSQGVNGPVVTNSVPVGFDVLTK